MIFKFEYHHPVMCWEYIDIIASNIPQMKIIAVSELLDSTYRESRKNAGVYLEICLLDCLTTKKFQDFSKISAKFQDFPGLLSSSRTFQDWWKPCHSQFFLKALLSTQFVFKFFKNAIPMLFPKIANYVSLETLSEPLAQAIIQTIIGTTGC